MPERVTNRRFGYSMLHMLERDKLVSGDWPDDGPDGYLTQDELRRAMQIQLGQANGDSYYRNRLEESREIFRLLKDEADAIDYLPDQLQGIRDVKTRMRAAEVLARAFEINNGRIDQMVIDNVAEKYVLKEQRNEITEQSKLMIMDQIGDVARALGLAPPPRYG